MGKSRRQRKKRLKKSVTQSLAPSRGYARALLEPDSSLPESKDAASDQKDAGLAGQMDGSMDIADPSDSLSFGASGAGAKGASTRDKHGEVSKAAKRRGIGLKKTEKRRDRKADFAKRVRAQLSLEQRAQISIKSGAASATRAKTSLQSLSAELGASIRGIERDSKKLIRIRPGKKLNAKQKKKQMASEVRNFVAVMSHPSFQAQPLDTIAEHLSNKIRAEKAKDEFYNDVNAARAHAMK